VNRNNSPFRGLSYLYISGVCSTQPIGSPLENLGTKPDNHFQTGIAKLDDIIGGFPNRSSILVIGAAGTGKEFVAYRFIERGLNLGEFCLYVTSSSVSDVVRNAKAFDISFNAEALAWIAAEGSSVKCDVNDLSRISFNVKEYLKGNAPEGKRARIVIDFVSPLLMLNPPETIYRFLSQLIREVKHSDAVVLSTVEEGMHDPQAIAALEQLFDGVIVLSQKAPDQKRVLEVKKIIGVHPTMSSIPIMPELDRNSDLSLAKRDIQRTNLSKRRVAVLPFSNLSQDPNDAYFADGMTEELISKISLIPQLSVISRTSVMTYKNQQTKKALDIGLELNVGTLLEGSVRKSGKRIRISAQLINVLNDKHLWAESYDRDLKDVFEIQSEVASNVAASLKLRLLPKEKAKIVKESTTNVDAHTLYLKGCYQYNKHNTDSYLAAIGLFEQAVVMDPQFALSYAKIGTSYALLGFQGLSADKQAYAKAEENAKRALALDELLPDAHIALGLVFIDKWDLPRAEKEFTRAIEINPNFAPAHSYYAQLLSFSRQFDKSILETQKALELDPLSAETLHWAGTAYLYAGRYNEAIQQFKNALEMDPKMAMARNNLGLAYIQQGSFESGLSEVKKAAELAGKTGYLQFANDLGYAFAKSGKLSETRKILSRLLLLFEKDRSAGQLAVPIAGLYASLEENKKALDWLEEAYKEHSPFLLVINSDLIYDSIREEPRFSSLIKKIGF
jgi:TolB-like protein/KaiC/GvpD/RAD55 family RecA-like ATPase/Tfp pilus assembly protein PilF